MKLYNSFSLKAVVCLLVAEQWNVENQSITEANIVNGNTNKSDDDNYDKDEDCDKITVSCDKSFTHCKQYYSDCEDFKLTNIAVGTTNF